MAKKLKKAKNQVPTDDYIQKLSSKFDRMNPIKKLKISCKILKINVILSVFEPSHTAHDNIKKMISK